MSNRYILVASRDPYASREAHDFFQLAGELASKGDDVTLYLVQNGVIAARRLVEGAPLEAVFRSGAQVLADDFSLRERGIGEDERHPDVEPTTIGSLVVRLTGETPARVLWH